MSRRDYTVVELVKLLGRDTGSGSAVVGGGNAVLGTTQHSIEGPEHTNLTGALLLNRLVAPPQITADQNDYAPTGLASADGLQLSSDAERAITGIAAPSSGLQAVLAIGVGAFAITLKHESVSSSAANRFSCPGDADFVLEPGSAVLIIYDSILARWAVLGGGAGGGLTVEELDGSPSVAVATLKFPPGTITDNLDGSASVRAIPSGTIRARARNSTLQSVANATSGLFLSLDTVDEDPYGFFDLGTDATKATCPPGMGGRYVVLASCGYDPSNTTGRRLAKLHLNGTVIPGTAVETAPPNANAYTSLKTGCTVDLLPGDYLQIQPYQDSGAALNVSNTDGTRTTLELYKLDAGRVGEGVGCRLYRSSNQTITGGYAGIQYDGEYQDSDDFHFASQAALTGTVTKTAASDEIVGSGTSFTTELSVNQVVSIPGTAVEFFVVKAITDATHFTAWQTAANTASGQTATRRSDRVAFGAGMAGWYLVNGQAYIANVANDTDHVQQRLIRNGGEGVLDGGFMLASKRIRREPGGNSLFDITAVAYFDPGDYLCHFAESADVTSFDVISSATGTDGGTPMLSVVRIDSKPPDAVRTVGVSFIIDGGGATITTGSKGHVEFPFACTVTAARLMGNAAGSIVVDVKRASYSGLPTTTSICASAKPTLSGAQKSQDTTLTGWSTGLQAGDWLEFVVDSVSGLQRVAVALTLVRN